jgi:hypothetical protein
VASAVWRQNQRDDDDDDDDDDEMNEEVRRLGNPGNQTLLLCLIDKCSVGTLRAMGEKSQCQVSVAGWFVRRGGIVVVVVIVLEAGLRVREHARSTNLLVDDGLAWFVLSGSNGRVS